MGADIPAEPCGRIAERRRTAGGRAPGGRRRARDVARAVPAAPVSVWPEDVRQRGRRRRRRAGEPHLDGPLRPRLPRRLLGLQLALHHRAPVLHQEAAPKQVRARARRVAGRTRQPTSPSTSPIRGRTRSRQRPIGNWRPPSRTPSTHWTPPSARCWCCATSKGYRRQKWPRSWASASRPSRVGCIGRGSPSVRSLRRCWDARRSHHRAERCVRMS